jgi:caffeoyl-CoA O-methyltransferase
MGTKAALRRIAAYTAAQTTPLSPITRELYDGSIRRFQQPAMSCGPVVGMILQMLVAAVRAKRVLEIGMYTGFSALMMAEALPDDGELITCEIDHERIAFGRQYFERSPHGRKIDVREGPALETLKTLQGPFDFVFLDAEKPGYLEYYEATLPLLAQGGLIAADDVLLGSVRDPRTDRSRAVVAFNEHVRNDDRVSQVMLTVRSGLTIIRKL